VLDQTAYMGCWILQEDCMHAVQECKECTLNICAYPIAAACLDLSTSSTTNSRAGIVCLQGMCTLGQLGAAALVQVTSALMHCG